MEAKLGDICYPKSQILIVHGNLQGFMDYGYLKNIVKDGWQIIQKEAFEQIKQNKNKLSLGDSFITGPGRLKRRGVNKIYHLIIREFPNDFTSLDIIQKGLHNLLKTIKDKKITCTVSSLGLECGGLEIKQLARTIATTCNHYAYLDIKVIDENEEFINYVKSYCF